MGAGEGAKESGWHVVVFPHPDLEPTAQVQCGTQGGRWGRRRQARSRKKGRGGALRFSLSTLTEWRLTPTPPPGLRRSPALPASPGSRPQWRGTPRVARSLVQGRRQHLSVALYPAGSPAPPPQTTLLPASGQSLGGLCGGSHPFDLLRPIRDHRQRKPRLRPRAPARARRSPARPREPPKGRSALCRLSAPRSLLTHAR